MSEPTLPRYGSGALSDLTPALLALLGTPGADDRLGLASEGPASTVVLLLVDGLGAELLDRYRDDAPYLSARSGRRLTTGFPSTTAASIASLATGRPPGGHGLVGYRIATPDRSAVLNTLRWRLDSDRETPPPRPEDIQPDPTLLESAPAGTGCLVAPAAHERSGLTAAVWRGAAFAAADAPDELVAAVRARAVPGALVVAYHGELDRVGHVLGPGSDEWRAELTVVDRLAERVAAELPPGGVLAVTGDHGMVRVAPEHRIDLDTTPELAQGVRLVGGEPRARHLYVEPGATADVVAAWRALLGDRVDVRTGAELVAAGWFGPRLTPVARAAIGDVVAVARADVAVIRSRAERMESSFTGHHGALTPAEALVPLVLTR